ncbi:ribosomal protein S18-alanine N-acetyltransferase [Aquitalea sp. FJL05]|uniref:ribosomal protein S18-alanine N-acetyltransferase n=1 Tax=Aquitalea sp. FJL05 TaxID=2153366 RepID=UPI001F406798|nr:ribosomal protein S18-alanine N-acetyltransferase [Aquitalea sp. FJL05]
MSSVHRYHPASAHSLATLEAAATPHGWSEGNYQDSINAGHPFYCLGQQEIGFAVVMPVLDEAELLNIVIAAPQQGRGLGRQLLAGLMQDLQQQGCQRLFLEVRASNTPARALYQRCGFRESGLRKNYYPGHDGQREHAILMEASL